MTCSLRSRRSSTFFVFSSEAPLRSVCFLSARTQACPREGSPLRELPGSYHRSSQQPLPKRHHGSHEGHVLRCAFASDALHGLLPSRMSFPVHTPSVQQHCQRVISSLHRSGESFSFRAARVLGRQEELHMVEWAVRFGDRRLRRSL